MSAATESLLVFSDVHLGSDLNDNGPGTPRSTAIDADLAALLAHYRQTPAAAACWHLVIAGDFVDFVGMAIDPREGDVLATPINAIERKFGLGGAEEHVRLKLRRAAERHPDVFTELGLFVDAGNAVTLIHGNHDLELHWDAVKDDFRALLSRDAEAQKRIAFEPWFFHRQGLAFIEHGHQYDPFCSTPHILSPLSPFDRTRVRASLSDTLLRHIVRRTPGMKEYGHETRGLLSYISWGLMLGARGTADLFWRFASVMRELWRNARAYSSAEGSHVEAEHDRQLDALATRIGVPRSSLEAARGLHMKALGATPRGVLASVMLDRFGTFLLMSTLLGATALSWARLGAAAPWVTGLLLASWVALHVFFSRGRPNVDPASLMADRAATLAQLFPTSFVVMGHTHIPMTKTVGEAIYINVGSWAEEEPDPGETNPYRAARTHLVVNAYSDRHEASLCEWRSGVGPRSVTELVRQVC